MEYSKEFRAFISRCANICATKEEKNKFLIGSGNPMSPILFVGQEPSGDSPEGMLSAWEALVQMEFKPQPLYKTFPSQHMWRNYQRIYEVIAKGDYCEHPDCIDFVEHIFTTEMSGIANASNSEARLMAGHNEELVRRKKVFFTDEYIQSFPVVVLACGNYLRNDEYDREINRIFNVTYDLENGEHKFNDSNWFYCHHNNDRTRLVIHTRNLSNGVKSELIHDMGDVIKKHLEYWNLSL